MLRERQITAVICAISDGVTDAPQCKGNGGAAGAPKRDMDMLNIAKKSGPLSAPRVSRGSFAYTALLNSIKNYSPHGRAPQGERIFEEAVLKNGYANKTG